MEELLEKISPKRQERFLNPRMSDYYKTFFFGKYGYRMYTIKVGRKWVVLRSNSHRARISLERFKTIAFVQWRRDVEAHTFNPSGKRKREWYKDYGFYKNPRDYFIDTRHLSWK
jgi:hypothetical protein